MPDRLSLGDRRLRGYHPEDGRLAPPTAQAAVQEGRVAARNVLAAIDGKQDRLEEFEYRPSGSSSSSAAGSP